MRSDTVSRSLPSTLFPLSWPALLGAVLLIGGCATPQTTASAQSPAAATAPSTDATERVTTNDDWWPDALDLSALRRNEPRPHPLGADFDYAQEFAKLDLDAVKKDIKDVLTTSQAWWPADYGNYGPLFIRLAWHSAGTYRVVDGRGGASGGQMRFEPLNSWPDNTNLDKARRLLWPVKQKYGHAISWGDLMILSGNVALESMGFKTLGFAGGREDAWEAEVVDWGSEKEMLASHRHHGDRKLKGPLAASRMGLIYVNPEGPNGKPDPLAAAQDIRHTFARMAMNDEETVALIAGGHTFGKAHGAHSPDECLSVEPAAEGVETQGQGWNNRCGKGNAEDTVTSGLEGAWTRTPAQWSTQFLDNLFDFEWELTQSPAGAKQWKPKDGKAAEMVPDAHVGGKRHPPMMLTTDLALKFDPSYREIAQRFRDDPAQFEAAFARAWFKLTHRDMGPRARYLGADVPTEVLAWQDPVPAVDHPLITAKHHAALESAIRASGLTVSELVRTAWAAAASFRNTDMRGGANGGRLRLAPQKDWAVNDPEALADVLAKLETVRNDFNAAQKRGVQISMADLIVFGGAVAIEKAAKDAGVDIEVPFRPGRTDASQAETNVPSFEYLQPTADGFRNYVGDGVDASPAQLLVERAATLGLTAREMTALVGGLRVLDVNTGGARHGVLTERPGTLSADFFTHLLDLDTTWSPTPDGVFEGRDGSGAVRWTATEVDLVFGSNAELRVLAELYAYEGAHEQFVTDFVAAWTKVMNADRFD